MYDVCKYHVYSVKSTLNTMYRELLKLNTIREKSEHSTLAIKEQ